MNITVLPLIVVWTALGIVLFPALFFIFKITTRWDTARITRQLIWVYGRGWIAIMRPFVRFKRVGFEQSEIKPPCIIVSNHSSFFDIYCLALLPYSNVSISVRNWPFKMFWYAPFMHLAGYLNVESTDWENTSKCAAQILSTGAALLWYPEAHRSPNGRLQRFYSGAFKLAVETGVRIVPICIQGTHEVLPPGRWWLKPARISLKALEPENPAAFTGSGAHRALRKVVKSRMARVLKEMSRESGNSGRAAQPVARV